MGFEWQGMPQKCIVKEISLQKLNDETQKPVIIGVNSRSCQSVFVKYQYISY